MNEQLGRAEYLSDMTVTLAAMARRDGHDVLAYLLEMARLEAESAMAALSKETIPTPN